MQPSRHLVNVALTFYGSPAKNMLLLGDGGRGAERQHRWSGMALVQATGSPGTHSGSPSEARESALAFPSADAPKFAHARTAPDMAALLERMEQQRDEAELGRAWLRALDALGGKIGSVTPRRQFRGVSVGTMRTH